MANVSGLFKIKQICFVKTGRTATISNSHFEYFEIGNLYCLLEYAMLYWNQIPISPDIWSRSVYRQKFVKNRLSDTRYHERLIKIAMSGPAKNFSVLWWCYERNHAIWEYLFVNIPYHFHYSLSLKFEFCIYFFPLQMAPLTSISFH